MTNYVKMIAHTKVKNILAKKLKELNADVEMADSLAEAVVKDLSHIE